MPAMTWWLLALPLLAGVLLPLQAGINGQLAKHLGSVLLAALISFCVGTLALLLLTLYQREMPLLGAFRGLTGLKPVDQGPPSNPAPPSVDALPPMPMTMSRASWSRA